MFDGYARLAHTHFICQHTAFPRAFFLLLHPVKAFLLKRQERKLERGMSLHSDGFDRLNIGLKIAPNVFELGSML